MLMAGGVGLSVGDFELHPVMMTIEDGRTKKGRRRRTPEPRACPDELYRSEWSKNDREAVREFCYTRTLPHNPAVNYLNLIKISAITLIVFYPHLSCYVPCLF